MEEQYLPVWGRKKQEAEDTLASTKALITKVKKKGVDVSRAVRLYKKALEDLENKEFVDAKEGAQEAEKSAKNAYANAVKDSIKLNLLKLNEKIKDMESKNIDTKKVIEFVESSREAYKKGVKGYKDSLKAVRQGLIYADERLKTYDRITSIHKNLSYTVDRIEDLSPDLVMIKKYRKKLGRVKKLQSKGKIDEAVEKAEKLDKRVRKTKKRHARSYKSVKSLEKALNDSEVLGAVISGEKELKEARDLLNRGKYKSARLLAEEKFEELSRILTDFKEAKHHLDLAEDMVQEVKNWGFSAYESEEVLNSAKESLKNNEFEDAIAKAKESREKASSIRERHKQTLELIDSAKSEVERAKARGHDISEFEEAITEAEDRFYKGDYSGTEEKIGVVFEAVKRGD